jgi:hypothetical protein
VIRPAKRPFDVAHLPEPAANTTGRSIEDWLADLRGARRQPHTASPGAS